MKKNKLRSTELIRKEKKAKKMLRVLEREREALQLKEAEKAKKKREPNKNTKALLIGMREITEELRYVNNNLEKISANMTKKSTGITHADMKYISDTLQSINNECIKMATVTDVALEMPVDKNDKNIKK